jgi:UDP-glucuronate decarboxylase
MSQRVLVTGGAGFLGSFLCEQLIQQGYEVLALDNLFTGNKRNIAHLLNNRSFEFIRHDVVEPILLEIDWIFNLACPASPVHYQHNPVKTIKTSILGAINMLGLAKRVQARILQASTSEIYGDPEIHPQTEDYCGYVNPIGPRSCYDEGKRVAETLMNDYRHQNGVDTRIIRIFNTYGPRMHPEDGRVVSNFIVAALRNEPLVLYGDGQQTRSFCYVSDLIEGIMRMMRKENCPGPINLGNPEEFTIRELAEQVVKLTNSCSPITYQPAREDDPGRRKPNIQLAQKQLGWEPTVPLEEGLLHTISYFDELLRNS